jgi:glycogen phosphorylase
LITPFLDRPRIAYFSMEIALAAGIPTYSGGLGILAGDTLRSAADLKIPMVGVTLASRRGYFRQEIDGDGRQIEHAAPWDPTEHTDQLHAKVVVNVNGRKVWVGGWLYRVTSDIGGAVPVILLDTDLPENDVADREITDYLYGGDQAYRLKQEIVLGIGGLRMLQALDFDICNYHMNEGHSALLAVELMRRFRLYDRRRSGGRNYNVPGVRALCRFTTHTPVEAGHDQFDWGLVDDLLDGFIEPDTLKELAGPERLNMTRLALNLSAYVNGVAIRHAETSRKMFPGFEVHAITNGVHPGTWATPDFSALYDRHVPGWRLEPMLLNRIDHLGAEDIWAAHLAAKSALIERVRARCGVALDPELPIIGFARRMTAYKRPELLFSNLERLRAIAWRYPLQIVLGGKAHPRDGDGKRAIEEIHQHIRALDGAVRAVFVPDYDMAVALDFVSGSDIWLNTPLRPFEASGTSGMKAAFNGVPQLSVLDGWWNEGCIEGVTGWAIGTDRETANGEDAEALYAKLEGTVLPLWHGDRARWIAVMKHAIMKNAAYFNSHRMLRRYAVEAYLR